MTGPEENSYVILFPENLKISQGRAEGNIAIQGKQN